MKEYGAQKQDQTLMGIVYVIKPALHKQLPPVNTGEYL